MNKNPLLFKALSLVLTVGGLIADKRKAKKAKEAAGDAINAPDTLEAELPTISATRALNLGGTVTLIGYALADMQANGITKFNLILAACGVVYSVGLALVSYLKEKGESK